MSFYRSSPHLVCYSFSNQNLDRITTLNDFGVLFDHILCFNSHITSMVNKAEGVLAFKKRWSNRLDDPYTTETLYVA